MRMPSFHAAPAHALLIGLFLCSCATGGDASVRGKKRSVTVTATAYSSTADQNDATPHHGAWGDKVTGLGKGVRAIAVSQDLEALGLERNRVVHIDSLKGDFVVLDRMPDKWKKRIDIHMTSKAEAERWGKRRVRISWTQAD